MGCCTVATLFVVSVPHADAQFNFYVLLHTIVIPAELKRCL
jgi:hypothetical protein